MFVPCRGSVRSLPLPSHCRLAAVGVPLLFLIPSPGRLLHSNQGISSVHLMAGSPEHWNVNQRLPPAPAQGLAPPASQT